MRHRKKLNHLGRTSSHRKAMLANMASSLILNKRISTTLAKAKALRIYVEPLITKSKKDSTHSRRIVFSYLKDKYAVSELFREVSPKVAARPGGYTRILKTGSRLGDNADMCIIELVDYNENMLSAPKEEKEAQRRSRRRRGGKKSSSTDKPAATEINNESENAEASAGAQTPVEEESANGSEDNKTENKEVTGSDDGSSESAEKIEGEDNAESAEKK